MTTATTLSPEETAEIHRLFDLGMRRVRFWQDNYERFLPGYDGQFVAADLNSGVVVATNADIALLVYELGNRYIKRDEIAIHYITSNPPPISHL